MPILFALPVVQQFNKYDSNSPFYIIFCTVTVTLKIANQSVLPDAQAYYDASSFHVCLQKAKSFRRYRPDEHSLKYFTFCCDLDLEHSIPGFFQDSPAHHDAPPN